MSALPLAGIRIADFTWVGAGPFVTKPLADHGADVIKVESYGRTDPIRTMRPFAGGKRGVNRSGYFANRNSSKRSICLDLKHPDGRRLALRLIAASDVVANNFTPGTMERLGLGYDEARRVRDDIVYLEMPMLGREGPHRDFGGYGLTLAALSGLYALSGDPDGPPVGTGTNYPDHVPNPLHGAIAILAALRHRRRTGRGQYIELSQLESTVNVCGAGITAVANGGGPCRRAGNADELAAPHGVYRCRGDDAWCAIAVLDDGQWRALVKVLGDPPELRDARYDTAAERRERQADLDTALGVLVRGWEAAVLADRLAAEGVPAERVRDAADLVARDRQLAARGHWVTLDHPEMGPSVYDAPPYRLSVTPGRLRSPAPRLGADTRTVCEEVLGLSAEEYDRHLAAGAFGHP